MKEGLLPIADSIYGEKEPYEDPDLNPGFVRSTKEYLKQANQINVQRDIERQEREILKNIGSSKVEQVSDGVSSGLSFMKANQTCKRGTLSPARVRNLHMSSRKATPTNAYFDSFTKMNLLMKNMQTQQRQHHKPSLKASTMSATVYNQGGVTIRGSNLDSIYRQSSPLAREMMQAATMTYHSHTSSGIDKQV